MLQHDFTTFCESSRIKVNSEQLNYIIECHRMYMNIGVSHDSSRPTLDFYFFSKISSRNPLYTTWYQWRLVQTWLSSINWQNKLQKSSKLKFLKFGDCKTFFCNKISTFCFGTYFRTLLLHLWNLIDMELNCFTISKFQKFQFWTFAN